MSNRKDKRNLRSILLPKQEECTSCRLSQFSYQSLFSETKTVGYVALNTYGKWYLFICVISADRETKVKPILRLSFRAFH